MLNLRINIREAALVMAAVIFSNLTIVSNRKTPGNFRLGAINNQFNLDLLRELRSDNEAANVFMAPLSISMMFGMLYYGSAGNTAGELERLLGYEREGMTKESVHHAFKHLLTHTLKKSENFTLNVANAILVDNELELLPDFKKKTQDTYFANVSSVDFKKDSSKIVNSVNSWVRNKTNGKISELVDRLNGETDFLILNAVYFRCLWKYPFEENRTVFNFFNNNGDKSRTKSVPMMRMRRSFGTAETSYCDALELPYVQDGIIMLILLPKRLDGLNDLEQKLTHRSIDKIIKSLSYSVVDVTIPKFKVEFQSSLVPGLKRLGIRGIFEDADLSGMIGDYDVPVSDFVHKAVIEVTEKGTEAAAVSATIVSKSVIREVNVDHPFFFAIVDKRIKFILFMGHVNQL